MRQKNQFIARNPNAPIYQKNEADTSDELHQHLEAALWAAYHLQSLCPDLGDFTGDSHLQQKLALVIDALENADDDHQAYRADRNFDL